MNRPKPHIAIGYDESTGYEPDPETDEELIGDAMEAMDELLASVMAHYSEHHAVITFIDEWPLQRGRLGRLLFDIGMAVYSDLPLIVFYQVGVEVPAGIRQQAQHVVSYDGDPMQSSTVVAMMARYA